MSIRVGDNICTSDMKLCGKVAEVSKDGITLEDGRGQRMSVPNENLSKYSLWNTSRMKVICGCGDMADLILRMTETEFEGKTLERSSNLPSYYLSRIAPAVFEENRLRRIEAESALMRKAHYDTSNRQLVERIIGLSTEFAFKASLEDPCADVCVASALNMDMGFMFLWSF